MDLENKTVERNRIASIAEIKNISPHPPENVKKLCIFVKRTGNIIDQAITDLDIIEINYQKAKQGTNDLLIVHLKYFALKDQI